MTDRIGEFPRIGRPRGRPPPGGYPLDCPRRAARLAAIVILALGPSSLIGAEPARIGEPLIALEAGPGPESLREKGAWLLDEPGALDYAATRDMAFELEPRVDFPRGIGRVWGRYRLASATGGSWVLFTRLHKAESIVLYLERADGRVETMRAGADTPARERAFSWRRPAFSIELAPGESLTATVAIKGSGHLYLDFMIATPAGFYNFAAFDEAFLFFYFGALAVILAYNLMVYFSSRDRNYLHYCAYVLCMLLYQLSAEGYGIAYLWPGATWFMPRSYNVFIALAFSAGLVFTRSYLDLERHSPRLDLLCRIQVAADALFALAFMVCVDQWLIDLGTAFVYLGALTIIVSGYYVLWRRYEPAGFFALAWTMLALGILVTTSKRVGLLPFSRLTDFALHIGNLLEVTLLALALGARVGHYQRKSLEAEEALSAANARILQDRMRPHFLFNSMNVIFNQLRESPERAQVTLRRLADNYHYLTETDAKALVPLREEWEFLRNYVELMRERWPGQLEVDESFDERLGSLPVPPVILQPLAENAFKYGLKELPRKRLGLEAALGADGMVSLIVSNDAERPLGPIDYGRSLGNIQARLRRYYPSAALGLSQEGGTVRARIAFPFPGALPAGTAAGKRP